MGIVDKAKKAAGLGGAAATAYSIVVKVEGAPLRERDKPAAVKLGTALPHSLTGKVSRARLRELGLTGAATDEDADER